MESEVALTTLRNTTGTSQSVVYQGRQFTLLAHEMQTFDADVAAAFLMKCSPIIIDVREDAGVVEEKKQEEQFTWIANMTGNPSAAEKVSSQVYSKDTLRWKEVQVTNPNKAPRVLSRELKGGHTAFIAKDGGLVQITNPSKTIALKPFQRRRLKTDEAEWFIMCDGSSGTGRGAAIISRGPATFEPDMSWSLDDMRVFLRLCDANAALGDDEQMLATKAQKETDKLARAAKKGDDKEWLKNEVKSQLKEGIRKAKNAVYQTLFFKLVDPGYSLPSRAEFNEFLNGTTAVESTEDELDAILAKAEKTSKVSKVDKESAPATA